MGSGKEEGVSWTERGQTRRTGRQEGRKEGGVEAPPGREKEEIQARDETGRRAKEREKLKSRQTGQVDPPKVCLLWRVVIQVVLLLSMLCVLYERSEIPT